jgi:hypothetical protein
VKRAAVAAGVLALAALLAGGSSAHRAAGPFYTVPTTGKECGNIKHCVGYTGPWVVVPATGEATFLWQCPQRRAYVMVGTDARASSNKIQISFSGQLGTPIGQAPNPEGAVLLFHAISLDGKQGAFEPVVGCVPLAELTKRSTLGIPGTAPSPPLDLRSRLIPVVRGLKPGTPQETRALGVLPVRCLAREKLVGTWQALVFGTTSPPTPRDVRNVVATRTVTGNEVKVVIRQYDTRIVTPLAQVQIGAMCAT